jgi:hypothetical protein
MLTKRADISSIRGPRRIYSGRLVSKSDRLLVWLHPKLHPAWKVVITLLIAGFCWLMFVAFQGFVRQFDEATKMLNEMKI